MKCRKGMPLPQTCQEIYDAVDQAFTMGDFTVDLFCCIAIINSLEDFPHICSSILRDLHTSTKDEEYTSKNICHYLESEQTLHTVTEKSTTASDIALAACTSNAKKNHSTFPPAVIASAKVIQTSIVLPLGGA